MDKRPEPPITATDDQPADAQISTTLRDNPIFYLALEPLTDPPVDKKVTLEYFLLSTAKYIRECVGNVCRALETKDIKASKEAYKKLSHTLELTNSDLCLHSMNLPSKIIWQYFEVILHFYTMVAVIRVDNELLPFLIESLNKSILLYHTFFKRLESDFDQKIDNTAKSRLQKTYLILAESYFAHREWGNAKKYYKESHRLSKLLKLIDPEYYAIDFQLYCSRNVMIAIKRGNMRKARQYAALCESALQVADDYGLRVKTIQEAYQEVGRHYLKQGNFNFSLYWYNRALAISYEGALPAIQSMINMIEKKIFLKKHVDIVHLPGFQIGEITCQWNENNFTLQIRGHNETVTAMIQEQLDKYLAEYSFDEQNKATISFNILPVNFQCFLALDHKLNLYDQECKAKTLAAQRVAAKPEANLTSPVLDSAAVVNAQPTPALSNNISTVEPIKPPPAPPILATNLSTEANTTADPTLEPPKTTTRIIKWADPRFPDTNLDQLGELTGELFHPDKKDHSIVHVNESAFPKKGASTLLTKVKNKLDIGKVIPDNTKNQEGFMLFSQRKPKQEEFKKLGENCHGKLKILGSMGKARCPLMWATQGKLYKNGKETDTVYQRYEINEVVEKSHHRI